MLAILLAAIAPNALAVPANEDFVEIAQFPTPAPGAFGVVGTNLPDGRFLLWNGLDVIIQDEPGSGFFSRMATGYLGDPGFIALSPDGHTALLGAGWGDGTTANLYLLDTNAPVDYTAGSEIVGPSHFSAAFLSESIVILDKGTPAFGAELVAFDISAKKSAPQFVSLLAKPPLPEGEKAILDKPAFAFSTSINFDPSGTILYVMDGNTRELRTFTTAAIQNAIDTVSTLDWVTDGTSVGLAGDYFGGGVSGFTIPEGHLVIAGSEGFLQPGGIQIVNVGTEAVVTTLDPAGDQPFYSAFVNSATGELIVKDGTFGSEVAYATSTGVPALPSLSLLGIAVLTGLFVTSAGRKHNKISRAS